MLSPAPPNTSSFLLVGVGILTTTLTTLYLIQRFASERDYKGKGNPDQPSEEKATLELLVGEEKGLIYASSVSSVTFYAGDISENGLLKARVEEILKENLWLSSELTYQTIQGTKHLVALHSKVYAEQILQKCYQEVIATDNSTKLGDLNDSCAWDSINEMLQPYTVETGTNCINHPEKPLFKITVIKIMDPADKKKVNKTALVVSLSHVLGDGHTFYRLYSFLDFRTPVTPLIATRSVDFMEKLKALQGEGLSKYCEGLPFLMGLLSTILLSQKPSATLLSINKTRIEETKKTMLLLASENQLHGNSVQFLSTNDLLTSWCMSLVKSSFGIMAVNLRNRLTGFTDAHAGNYETCMFLPRDDYRSPVTIRQSSLTGQFRASQFPSIFQSLEYNISCVSNWSSFYHHLQFPEDLHIRHLVHLPLMDLQNCIFKDTGIIFKPNETDLSVLLLHRTKLTKEEVLNSADFVSFS